MPERSFDTGYWSDPDIVPLPMRAKLLYLYLWTNVHCNQAGLYQIALKTVSWETGIAEEEIDEVLKLLEKKVVWFPEENIIWVKNFLRRQSKSSKFLVAAIDSIKKLHNTIPQDMKDEFYAYNEALLTSSNIAHEPSLSKRECVILRDNFQCQYCGAELRDAGDYEVDHITPKMMGGKDSYPNLAASCHACNMRKANKMPEEVELSRPNVSSFHAAQAIFLLKNDTVLRQKWLRMFPDKVGNVESMLGNIDSRYSSDTDTDTSTGTDKEKGVVKGKEKNVQEVFTEMRSYLGFPDKVDKDPIPSYGREGQAIKRMMTRGFTREAIVQCWKSKVSQRGGEFVSMTWVNEDIGKSEGKPRRGRQLSTEEEIAESIRRAKS